MEKNRKSASTPETGSTSSNEKKPKSSKNKVRKIILRVLMVICVIVMAVSGFMIYQIWNRGHVIQKETEAYKQYLTAPSSDDGDDSQAENMPQQDPGFSVDWAGLKAANPNINAWLIVPGTGISFPVVQASDNQYYLNHSFDGAVNNLGAVFLDATQNPDYRNDNSIIYAHSVDIGGMFTSLKDFANLDFFNSHPYFWLLTPEQNYRCTINAFYMGSDSGAVYTTNFGDYRTDVMNDIESQAMYYRPMDYEGKRFVTLSTCNLNYGLHSDQRYVVMGMMEAWSAPVPLSEAS